MREQQELQETGPAQTRPIRLGIVGCGWISSWHGRAVERVLGAELVACCDVNQDAARSFADRFGCEESYTDYRQMIAEANLDGIILATWPTDHFEQINACLEAGVLNILCEKSITADAAEVYEIWKAARAANALIVEGFAYRSHPSIALLEEIIASGELGKIDSVSATFDHFDAEGLSLDDPNRNWRSRKDLRGGVPFDHLCYCVNASNRMANAAPITVMAVAKESAKYGTINRVYGVIDYENGVVGMVQSSKGSNISNELKVNGASGSALIPSMVAPDRIPPREYAEPGETTEIQVKHGTDLFQWETKAVRVPAADSYLLQMENFAAAIRGWREPMIPLAESVYNVYTIEALLTSAETQTVVSVDVPAEVRDEMLEVFQKRA
jgi:predicted dehydrogenase